MKIRPRTTNQALRDQWHFLDQCAQAMLGNDYWSLGDRDRLAVHFAINERNPKLGTLLDRIPGIHNGSWGGYPEKKLA